MSLEFLSTALLTISVLTSLTVEGVKKVLNSYKKTYSSNLLAIIVSTVITIIASVVYILTKNIPFSFGLVIEVLILVFLSFLVSTIGYDKVMQMLKQFMFKKDSDVDDSKKDDNNAEE